MPSCRWGSGSNGWRRGGRGGGCGSLVCRAAPRRAVSLPSRPSPSWRPLHAYPRGSLGPGPGLPCPHPPPAHADPVSKSPSRNIRRRVSMRWRQARCWCAVSAMVWCSSRDSLLRRPRIVAALITVGHSAVTVHSPMPLSVLCHSPLQLSVAIRSTRFGPAQEKQGVHWRSKDVLDLMNGRTPQFKAVPYFEKWYVTS
jgi:hypothetical protein